jgi:hypothetical protein
MVFPGRERDLPTLRRRGTPRKAHARQCLAPHMLLERPRRRLWKGAEAMALARRLD